MSNWETIQDKSSHLSPVKFTIQRDHSAERVDDMFKGIIKIRHSKGPHMINQKLFSNVHIEHAIQNYSFTQTIEKGNTKLTRIML